MIFLYSILSVLIISLISISAVFFLAFKNEILQKVLKYLMSFAAGALLGDAFFHLLPETAEEFGFSIMTSVYVLLGILVFFIVEKYINWRHCHDVSGEHCENHRLAKMNLVGDFVHNFIDGMIIAGSFATSFTVGVSTSIAIMLHEIPQEIGDLGVLMYSGVKKARAVFLNFLTSLSSILGVIFVIVLSVKVEGATAFLMPFASGGFVYIACSDLIPELHKEVGAKSSFYQLLSVISGMAVIGSLLLLETH